MGSVAGHAVLLMLLILTLFFWRTFDFSFYDSIFLYLSLVAVAAALSVWLLYRSLRQQASAEEQRQATYYLKFGFLTVGLGVLLSAGAVYGYGPYLDDDYARRFEWENQRLNNFPSLPAQVRAEVLEDQQAYDEAGLEEWLVVGAVGLGGLLALAGLLPFVLNYQPQKEPIKAM